MKPIQVVLIDATGHIAHEVIADVAKAIDDQVKNEFYKVWQVSAQVTALEHTGLLEPFMWPVFIVSEAQDHSAGFHKFSHGQPYAEVTEAPGYDWSVAASHEVLEMLVDPSGSRLVPALGIKLEKGRVEDTEDTFGYLLEICDPSEDLANSYASRTNKEIYLSDFYTRSFFDATDQKRAYSYRHKIPHPRRVVQGGYLTWWDPDKRRLCQLDYTGTEPRINTLPPHSTNMSLREHSDWMMRGKAKLYP